MNPYAESVHRDNLQRHRANCLAHAIWGLYNAFEGQSEPRRWERLAPMMLSKSKGGSGGGSVALEMGDGGFNAEQSRVPVPKYHAPGMLTVRVPELEVLEIEAHRLVLFRSDYEATLILMPVAWSHAWHRFERSSFQLSPFGLVKNPRTRSAYFRTNTSTSDPLMCATLWLAEVVTVQNPVDDLPPMPHADVTPDEDEGR